MVVVWNSSKWLRWTVIVIVKAEKTLWKVTTIQQTNDIYLNHTACLFVWLEQFVVFNIFPCTFSHLWNPEKLNAHKQKQIPVRCPQTQMIDQKCMIKKNVAGQGYCINQTMEKKGRNRNCCSHQITNAGKTYVEFINRTTTIEHIIWIPINRDHKPLAFFSL